MKINYFKLSVSVLVCLGAGFLGSVFTTPYTATWYAGLIKPSFNPPSWVFAPVWTTLFILMGVSFYIVWNKNYKLKTILIFAGQLILNILWSYLFFYLQRPDLAFFELVVLWLAILYTIINFRPISKTASYLLFPYILWVTFAGVLNLSIWLLNI